MSKQGRKSHKPAPVPTPRPGAATTSSRLPQMFVLGFLVLGAVAIGVQVIGVPKLLASQRIIVPGHLSVAAAAGKIAFEENCAACHGINAAGTEHGPPFINMIYNPGHHPNDSFYAAAHYGVRQHHWYFGDMPAQPQVTDAQISRIIAYVRELQEANGIRFQPHIM